MKVFLSMVNERGPACGRAAGIHVFKILICINDYKSILCFLNDLMTQ